jgi:large conductance mechanosensitive channel
MWAEYKAFLFRGNLLDLAVAFILGIAFAGVVTSFTEDVLGQLIAAIVGQPNFDQIGFSVNDTLIGVGPFLTALVNFLIVASVLFFIMRAAARFQRPAPEEAPAPDTDEVILLREIRDELRINGR